MSDIYRLVYTSRNLLQGTEDERVDVVAQILATSQRNNSKVGVTGALLFNAGSFAQVLEGPREAVEATFERIQRDPRHSDVSVLQCEAVPSRGFSNWSMAFIGHSARGRSLWHEIASRTGFDLSRIEGDQLFQTLHRIVVEEEGLAADTSPTIPLTGTTTKPGFDVLDVEQLRSRVAEVRPASSEPTATALAGTARGVTRNVGVTSPGLDVAILKKALDEERERTTSLRRSLDETRIALAVANDQVETLRRHTDVWAERARALASALTQEPQLAQTPEVPVSSPQGKRLASARSAA